MTQSNNEKTFVWIITLLVKNQVNIKNVWWKTKKSGQTDSIRNTRTAHQKPGPVWITNTNAIVWHLRGHPFMTSTKNDQFFVPQPHLIHNYVTISRPPTPFHVGVYVPLYITVTLGRLLHISNHQRCHHGWCWVETFFKICASTICALPSPVCS